MSTTEQRRSDIISILDADDKKMFESKNFLTLLARRIMYDIDMRPRQFVARVEQWLNAKLGHDKKALSKIATDRNNFYAEASHTNMTANTFRKFTEMMGAKEVNISITLKFDDGRPNHTSQIMFTNSLNPGHDPLEQGMSAIQEEIEHVYDENSNLGCKQVR